MHGLGRFSTRFVKGRAGRNPQTGEGLRVSARKRLGFKPSSDLTATVSDQDVDTAAAKAKEESGKKNKRGIHLFKKSSPAISTN
jgi:hypothetical protein